MHSSSVASFGCDEGSAGAEGSGGSSSFGNVKGHARIRRAILDAVQVLRSQQEGCKGLQLIFDDVLEAQRIEQGRLRLRDEVVDVTRVLDSIVATFRHMAEKKGVLLRLSLSSYTGVQVRGDGVRMKQVLANLVSNALNFTDSGGSVVAELHIELLPVPKGTNGVVLGSPAPAPGSAAPSTIGRGGGRGTAKVVPLAMHRIAVQSDTNEPSSHCDSNQSAPAPDHAPGYATGSGNGSGSGSGSVSGNANADDSDSDSGSGNHTQPLQQLIAGTDTSNAGANERRAQKGDI